MSPNGVVAFPQRGELSCCRDHRVLLALLHWCSAAFCRVLWAGQVDASTHFSEPVRDLVAGSGPPRGPYARSPPKPVTRTELSQAPSRVVGPDSPTVGGADDGQSQSR